MRATLACLLSWRGGYPGGGNLEFFKFRFLRFIAFLVNSNFEFFKFGTLEKICIFRLKNANIFCRLKYYLYLCNAGREQSPPRNKKVINH